MGIFGSKLREFREQAKKTLKDLAEAMDVSVVYVSDIERGRRNPPQTDKLIKIAHLLNIDVHTLEDWADRDRSRVELNFESRTEIVSDAALVLARKWDTLTDEEASEIMEIFKKRGADE